MKYHYECIQCGEKKIVERKAFTVSDPSRCPKCNISLFRDYAGENAKFINKMKTLEEYGM